MEESDHEMSDEAESDSEAWAGLIPGPDERMEQCKLGGKVLKLPELFLEKKHIFKSVLSMETWNTTLSDDQRKRLQALLPDFPEEESEETQRTLEMLFSGENIKFGNPLHDLQRKLKEGYLHPEIARYRKQTRQFRYRDYKMRQQRHLSDLLKRLLLSRQELFEHATALAPGDPIKFQCQPPPAKKISPMEQIIKKKTIRILKEVREECGVPDTSSDEDEESTSPVQRSRRQLFKSLGPIPSPEPTIPSVVATYATKPMVPPPSSSIPMVNGDAHHQGSEGHGQVASSAQAKRPRPISPVEVTEDNYKFMLRLHKRKRLLKGDLPELDTSTVNLQDILARCQANKKNLKGGAAAELLPTNLATMKKRLKMKAKGEKKPKIKAKEPPAIGVEDDAMLPRLPSPGLDASSNFHASDGLPDNPLKTVFGPAVNFCCLLRDILLEFPDGKTSTSKLEERLREWLEQNDQISNPWMALLSNWEEQVTPALKFLSGIDQGAQQIDNFSPMVECCSSSREKPQQYRWVGPPGLDSDSELKQLFRLWLQAKEEASNAASAAADVIAEISVSAAGSPPPPKAKTNFIVRPTSSNEKALFREQERSRFASPHKAFTFMMHGYDSVVGPVKGVYDKDSSTNKAREHNLLVSDRPPFVTILTLVRDAAARLPNGEGTRGDICELLKDSQFLAPGVTDTQINAVVSGALDRLHSEKDPCVKYDVTRKLWIYLHRNRTEDEFERIHQAQAATAKTKKTVPKPKTAKLVKDFAVSNSTAAPPALVQPTRASSPLHQPSFTLSTLPTTAPVLPQQPPAVTPKPTVSESASLLTKSGKSATLLRTPSLSVGGLLPPGVTSLTPTIAQLKAAQAAMAKSASASSASSGSNVSKLQTVKQLTSGGHSSKKTATLAGQLSSSSTAAASVGSPILTVTSLGLSMTSSSSSAIFSSPSLSASSSLAAQLLYSQGITIGSASPLTAVSSLHHQNLHQTQHAGSGKQKSGATSASSSSSSPSTTPSLTLSSISVPATTAATFSLVTTLNTGAAVGATANPTALRPPTISMLQSQQLLKQQQQQQLLLKQQQQQTISQSILRQNAALVAAVGQTVALAKSSDSVSTTAVSSATTVGKSATSATILKPHTFTMTARPSPPSNVAVTKHPTAISSLKPSSVANLKQASLILSQEGVASLTSAAGGVPTGGKLVALTSVAGQQAGEGTVMAQIMQQAAVAQHTAGVRNSTQAIRLQGGNLVQPILSGKPIQIGGKPFGTTKGLVQLAGKGGQPLGLIRTPQGPLSTINLIPQPIVSSAAGKTATVVAVGSSSSSVPKSASPLTTTASPSTNIITTSASTRQQQQLAAFAAAHSTKSNAGAGQAKILGQTPAGLVVTQLAPGNIALRAGSGQTKVLPSGQASLVPTQFILQHAPGAVATSQGTSAPIIVSSNAAGGKGAQNLQVMRTVLSQPGNLKAGQATILISQPTLPQVAVSSTQGLTAAQVLHTGGKTSGRGSPKGKGQPVYARIITPPPGMKLSSVSQVPISGGGGGLAANTPVGAGASNSNINVIQTVGGKLTLVTSGMATHTLSSLPMVSLAMVNSPANQVVVGAGDALQAASVSKEAKVDKIGPDGS